MLSLDEPKYRDYKISYTVIIQINKDKEQKVFQSSSWTTMCIQNQ